MFIAEERVSDPMLELVELHTRAKAAFHRAFISHDELLCDQLYEFEARAFEALAAARPITPAGAAALVRYLLTCDREWPDDFRVELLTALEAAMAAALKQQATAA